MADGTAGFDIEAPDEVRGRLCLALDTDDLVEATRRARAIGPWFGTVKVGLELFCSQGPTIVRDYTARGLRVMLDLKLHDIPETVARATAWNSSSSIA